MAAKKVRPAGGLGRAAPAARQLTTTGPGPMFRPPRPLEIQGAMGSHEVGSYL